jgi:hypothetical protein
MSKRFGSIAALFCAAASLGIAVTAAPQNAAVPQKAAATANVVVYKSPT